MSDASEVARLRAGIQAVLDDCESGDQPDGTFGWGPDVTTLQFLRRLLDDPEETAERFVASIRAPETPERG